MEPMIPHAVSIKIKDIFHLIYFGCREDAEACRDYLMAYIRPSKIKLKILKSLAGKTHRHSGIFAAQKFLKAQNIDVSKPLYNSDGRSLKQHEQGSFTRAITRRIRVNTPLYA